MANGIPLAPLMVDTTEDEDARPETDLSITVLDDGNAVVDLNPPRTDKDEKFDDNLALKMGTAELALLAEDLLSGIEADIQSRAEWESTRAQGIELLGLKIEASRSDITSAPLEGMSNVRHPVLLEACLRAQANASGELLPASGPVKIDNSGPETQQADEQSERLEKDFNYYLTKVATEYYPDTRRTLFWSSFGGSGFKKLYHCPLRRRPVSESVDANDLIISNGATDLANAPRVTHRIKMAPSVMKRMQIVEAYRDAPLTQPQPTQNTVDLKLQSVEGVKTAQDRPEDQPYTLYESYCEVDLPAYAPTQFKNKALPLPYKVTVDKDSRQVLEVRRFWNKDDAQCMRKKRIVKYPYVEAMGIYGIGLVHILGNSARALTAIWREGIDAGMFASFPGGVAIKSAGRQLTNELRVPPGGLVEMDAPSGNIRDALMALPYKDVTVGLLTLLGKVEEVTQRLGGTAELPVGEGKQDAPVGTTLALIEQATKVESAVHKGLHQAQSEEFEILLDLFREDPEAFWRHRPDCKSQWNEQNLLAAIDNCRLCPVADPNTPSHMHRIAKALAIKQLQAANPQLYNAKAVDERILKMIRIDDAESLFAPQTGTQQPDPIAMAKAVEAQAKMLTAQTAAQKVKTDSDHMDAKMADAAAQRQTDKDIATVNLAKELVIHGSDRDMAMQKHALAAQTAAHKAGMDVGDALQQQNSHGLAVAQASHDASLARDGHSLAVAQALHAAGQDRASHGLATAQATHDADLARKQHDLAVYQAKNPPKKETP